MATRSGASSDWNDPLRSHYVDYLKPHGALVGGRVWTYRMNSMKIEADIDGAHWELSVTLPLTSGGKAGLAFILAQIGYPSTPT